MITKITRNGIKCAMFVTHVETIGKETKIHFRFFNEFFEMLPRDFSNALGFSKKCILEDNALIDDLEYDRSAWWNEISDEPVSSKNSIVSIHNPTLRVLAKYLAMVVFSRADLRLCSSSELMCLYAMSKKIRYSPVMGMVAHWQKMITCKSPIDIGGMSVFWRMHKSYIYPRRMSIEPSLVWTTLFTRT